jgi:hypothetical protein
LTLEDVVDCQEAGKGGEPSLTEEASMDSRECAKDIETQEKTACAVATRKVPPCLLRQSGSLGIQS